MAGSESFSQEVVDELKHYVYRLIDPRDGVTFYVGKGCGNRVFSHARAELTETDDGESVDAKMGRIREIRNAGFEVGHVIHRHGMDELTAFEVEAALIDAYPGISNVVSGIDSEARGTMHATEIIRRYRAEEASFKHKIILINIARSADDAKPLYEAVRYAWKIDKSKAEQAEYVLATKRGLIVGAFVAQQWLKADEDNFPDRDPAPGRLGFKGKEAPADIENLYVGKRVPDKYRKRGAANPVKYAW